MTFRAVDNGGASCCEWIAAQGVITADTPRAFTAFVAKAKAASGGYLGGTITFDSPGGDTLAAMALGREIRAQGAWTDVGKTVPQPPSQYEDRPVYDVAGGGTCLDACALAFMGGASRSFYPGDSPAIKPGSAESLGFASFDLTNPASILGKETAQHFAEAGIPGSFVANALRGYATEMGLDPKLFDLAAPGLPGAPRVFSEPQAIADGLSMPDPPVTTWQLRPALGGLALFGKGRSEYEAYTTALQCYGQQPGSLLFSLVVPAGSRSVGTQTMAQIVQSYAAESQHIQVQGATQTVRAHFLAIQAVGQQVLLTAVLGPDAVQEMQNSATGHEAVLLVATSHAFAGSYPNIAFSVEAVEAIPMLLRNCPR